MLPFTIYSILGDISLGLSTTEISGSVRSRNGKQQWPEQSWPSYISPMKLTCQYRLTKGTATDRSGLRAYDNLLSTLPFKDREHCQMKVRKIFDTTQDALLVFRCDPISSSELAWGDSVAGQTSPCAGLVDFSQSFS